MDEHRWPKLVHRWDSSLKTSGWSDQAVHILNYLSMDTDLIQGPIVDLDVARSRMLAINHQLWKIETTTKTKLRTYLVTQADENRKALVNANLSRSQGSLVAKFKLGILPLQVEVGRWKDAALEERYCKLCQTEAIEDEFHFFMQCDKFIDIRTTVYLDLHEKTDVVVYGNQEQVLRELFSNRNMKVRQACREYVDGEERNSVQHKIRGGGVELDN